ncbi:MAG: hypothetical protein AAGF66_07385 [Cyanobacteria bacterium P01_H01_bin.119]
MDGFLKTIYMVFKVPKIRRKPTGGFAVIGVAIAIWELPQAAAKCKMLRPALQQTLKIDSGLSQSLFS